MSHHPTARSGNYARQWRFRIGEVKVSMFEMIAVLAALVYLPEGVGWLAQSFSEDGINPLSSLFPMWDPALRALCTVFLVLYVVKIRKHHISYLGLSPPLWKSDATFSLVLLLLAASVYGLILAGLAVAIHNSPETFGANADTPVLDVIWRNFCEKDISLGKVVQLVIIAPITEEIWFRGWMYPVVRKQFNAALSIFFVAIIFAFAHGQFPIAQLIGGFVFTFAYEKRPNLFIPIAFHILGNGSLLLISWLLIPAG